MPRRRAVYWQTTQIRSAATMNTITVKQTM